MVILIIKRSKIWQVQKLHPHLPHTPPHTHIYTNTHTVEMGKLRAKREWKKNKGELRNADLQRNERRWEKKGKDVREGKERKAITTHYIHLKSN